MSFYEELPIYKKALDLAIHFEKVVRGFEKYHKYTVGTELRNLSREILILVALANTSAVREQKLKEALSKLEELKILVRICREIKAFRSFNSYEFAVKSTADVAGVV